MELFRLFCWLIGEPIGNPFSRKNWQEITKRDEARKEKKEEEEKEMDEYYKQEVRTLFSSNEKTHSLLSKNLELLREEFYEKHEPLELKMKNITEKLEKLDGIEKYLDTFRASENFKKFIEKLKNETDCKIKAVEDIFLETISERDKKIEALQTDIKHIVDILNHLESIGVL